MSRRPRRDHSAAFKVKVALAAMKGENPLTELAEPFDVHAKQITRWKRPLLVAAACVFGETGATPAQELMDVEMLHAKVGVLVLENDVQKGRSASPGC
jgi:transposase